ncbi:nonribosomal peptide synthetase fmqC [Aspergillus fischeri NRRL 181]|uniref:Nonribosomal peptide synthase, putative n=1 Tax=Neosartorya fischeri (strain ATCC 1020 / DSM 3700 / CBS 544.65 / FGSC A1164 / JCM 1740 / NRRL 181 / WB 181) TaxID=331117 RepID=A1DNS8_NEOFI|nr:nonribosomal peptide synthase, putative [Aspergillus fischeri NRRL 181]EAW16449.1 nonribosomal peptide synthase, putative [Aspergillus fischeri NRRL 181]KAG2024257.1 hypothetical protein GB937_003907 [Aspergillus fischeri]
MHVGRKPDQPPDLGKHSDLTRVEVLSGDVGDICTRESSPSFGPEDRVQLLQWNQNITQPGKSCVHTLIQEKALTQPDAPAIHSWDGAMTYAELDRSSSAVAAHLTSVGIGSEVLVPLCYGKSRWAVVAMLAVLKAGGAFVLIDQALPMQRMQAICDQIRPKIVITSSQHAAVGANFASKVVVVDERSEFALDPSWQSPPASPENALYVMFTSGSTGQPKGVVVEHKSYSNHALACAKCMSLDSSARVLQFTSYAFDITILEILGTLIVGGCVCIPSDEERLGNLAGAINALHVNTLMLTPSVSRLLTPADIPCVKTLVLAGEPMTAEDIGKWTGKVTLVNGYGPAECTVLSTIQNDMQLSSHPRDIGRAVGCTSWVVDQDDPCQLLPIGAIGELLIEGPNVGRGYLNREALTRRAFINSPPWRNQFPGWDVYDRMYKTGDLVQYASDGSLRYIGRKDLQVKLRGQRLELAEVEHYVRVCFPSAGTVICEKIVRNDLSCSQAEILVAFVHVHSPGSSDSGRNPLPAGAADLAPPSDTFREQVETAAGDLHKVLPAYMIPTVFLPLYRVPLSPTGKTDRRHLNSLAQLLPRSAIEAYGVQQRAFKRAPSTPEEWQLRVLWSDILGLPADDIGADDDFFWLGANSLDAMKMVSRGHARGMLGLTVPAVFEFPTLSALAPVIHQRRIEDHIASLPRPEWDFSCLPASVTEEWQSSDIVAVLPTTDFQRIYLDAGLKNYYIWRIDRPIDVDQLQHALQTLCDQVPVLRSLFVRHADTTLQVVLRRMQVELTQTIVDEDSVDEECRSWCAIDNNSPEVPDGSPYFKPILISSKPSKHILILRLSHAQFDGSTLPHLLGALVRAYQGHELSQPVVDFTAYMQHRLARRTPAAYCFWRDYLHGASLLGWDWLTGNASGDNTIHRAFVVGIDKFPLSSPPRGITMATLVKAAWALALARLSKQTDLVFGHTVSGRNMPIPDVDRMAGCCINTAPIRVRIQPAWTAHELLRHVHTQYTRTLDYETIEPSEIMAQCTAWQGKPDFGSVVTHNQFDNAATAVLEGASDRLEPLHLGISEDVFQSMSWPVQLMTELHGSEMEVIILASSHMLPQDRADWMIGNFKQACLDLLNSGTSSPLQLDDTSKGPVVG